MRKHHEGSVYQRSGGTWHASVSLPGGRRRTVSAKSEQDAYERLAILKREVPQRRLFIKTSRLAFIDLIQRHLDWAAAEGWSIKRTAEVMGCSLSNARIKYGICGPCVYCGTPMADSVDHVVPIAKGGTDDPDNLVSACWDCNAAKGSMQVGRFLISQKSRRPAEHSAEFVEATTGFEPVNRGFADLATRAGGGTHGA